MMYRIDMLLPDGRPVWWMEAMESAADAWVWGMEIAARVAGYPTARVQIRSVTLTELAIRAGFDEPLGNIPIDLRGIFD